MILTSRHRLQAYRAVALLLTAGVAACATAEGDRRTSPRTSPFALFGRDDMRAGIPYLLMERTARKESPQPLECAPLWARARECKIRIEPGSLAAVVDSTDRVIRLVVIPEERIVNGQDIRNQLVLREAVAGMTAAWDSVGTSRREVANEEPPQLRWLDKGGRWGAALWYGTERGVAGARSARTDAELRIAAPDSFAVTDLPAYSLLLQRRTPTPVPRKRGPMMVPVPPPPPTREQIVALMRSDLRELTIRQEEVLHGTGQYALSLDRLHVVASAGVQLAFIKATPEGWSAVARHPAVAGASCVVYAGIIGDPPRTQRAGLRGAAGEVVCDTP